MAPEPLRAIALSLEPATTEAFAPFGELIAAPEGEPAYRGIQAQTWHTAFASSDPVTLMYTRFGWQEPVFTKLERHRGVTQTFIALQPRAFVMVVAPPTPAGNVPDPESIRAFTIPAGGGVIIGDDVWHALDRFLFEPEPLDCVMLTSSSVQAELEAQYRNGTQPTRTDVTDYAERGLSFRLSLQ